MVLVELGSLVDGVLELAAQTAQLACLWGVMLGLPLLDEDNDPCDAQPAHKRNKPLSFASNLACGALPHSVHICGNAADLARYAPDDVDTEEKKVERFMEELHPFYRVHLSSQGVNIEEACSINCPCDQPDNWRSQSVSLTSLKEVEIKGFRGEKHEVDLLKVILRNAAMLERMALYLSNNVSLRSKGCMDVRSISKIYPSVECNIYRCSN
ncbi:hypothetical protein ACP70R_023075 [Stipagrostis hirtigluma subsp. patula]